VYLNSESPYTPLLGVCPDLLLKLLKLNIIEVGTKSPWGFLLQLYLQKDIKNTVVAGLSTIRRMALQNVES